MSRWNESYEEHIKREDEERRQYHNDVFYEVWRSGRDPDRIDYDRVQDHYYQGDSSESAAKTEISAQRRSEQRAQEHREEEAAYWQEQERLYHEQKEQPQPESKSESSSSQP